MTKSIDDKFVIEEILPAIRRALHMEDTILQHKLRNSEYSEFYDTKNTNIRGISSGVLTERTMQYVIFRELCADYKLLTEDNAYKDSKRLDMSIYREDSDPEYYAEIGVEIKWCEFNKEGELLENYKKKVGSDYKKIQNIENKSKYLLLLGAHTKSSVSRSIQEQLSGNDKKYSPRYLANLSFPINGYNKQKYFQIVLFKVRSKR